MCCIYYSLHCVTQGEYGGVVIKWVYSAIHYQQGITVSKTGTFGSDFVCDLQFSGVSLINLT